MMHRMRLEIEVERVDALMKQIGAQNEVAESAIGALAKLFAGPLQKISGASDLTKNLATCKTLLLKAHAEIAKLKQLQSECGLAQARARAELPDYTKFATDGRHDTVPGRSFFVTDKTGGREAQIARPFESAQKHESPLADLGYVQMARRFQDRKGDWT